MINTKTLLKTLTNSVPPGRSAENGLEMRHNITYLPEDDTLQICLMLDGKFVVVVLSEDDYGKPMGKLIQEICHTAEQMIDFES